MEKQKKLLEEIAFVAGLKTLAEAYEEIATIKMRAARDSVLVNREFLNALSEVFFNVKESYKKKILQKQQGGIEAIHFAHAVKNGKEVLVFFSANDKLYGDIISKIFSLFLEEVKEHPEDDIVVVGQSGKEMFLSSGQKKDCSYFDIPDALTSYEAIKPLFEYLSKYEHVKVFYGKFTNVLSQDAIQANLSGEDQVEIEKDNQDKKEGLDFYFEPSIEKILTFFQTQVFSLLLQQTVHETELARLASRIKAMEQAIEQTDSRLGTLGKTSIHIKHDLSNKKQLEQVIKVYFYKNR